MTQDCRSVCSSDLMLVYFFPLKNPQFTICFRFLFTLKNIVFNVSTHALFTIIENYHSILNV